MEKLAPEMVTITIKNRVDKQKTKCKVPIKIPLVSVSALCDEICQHFDAPGIFEVRYMKDEEEFVLDDEGIQVLSNLLGMRKVTELYLFSPDGEGTGKAIV